MKRTFLVALWVMSGCRGTPSAEPPVHLNLNMDFQSRFDPQEANPFFADGRAMRPQVTGTVARGELHEDDHLYRGMTNGAFATTLPMPVSAALVARGRERFDIYCAPCHDRAGSGQGLVAQRGIKQGMIAPPDFHSDRIRAMPVGQLFGIITAGARSMPSYAAQIPVEDRWAVVSYLRALQISRRARLADVPQDVIEQKGWQP